MPQRNYDREHLAAVLEAIGPVIRGSELPAPEAVVFAHDYLNREKNAVPFARISRVRLEAFGAEPHTVQYVLYDHAKHFSKVLGETCVSWGEEVLERDLNFTPSSDYAWRGRLILHCDVSGGQTE